MRTMTIKYDCSNETAAVSQRHYERHYVPKNPNNRQANYCTDSKTKNINIKFCLVQKDSIYANCGQQKNCIILYFFYLKEKNNK